MLPTSHTLPILPPSSLLIRAAVPQEPPPAEAPIPAGPNPGAPGPATGTVQDPNAARQPAPTGIFGGEMLLYVMLFLVVMMLFSSRRDSKARKAQQAMQSSIKQGDRVVTSAGIHGTVHRLDDATVTLLLDSAKVTFERTAIARVLRDDPAKSA